MYEWMRFTGHHMARNHLSTLMKLKVLRDPMTSIWAGFTAIQVNIMAYLKPEVVHSMISDIPEQIVR